MASMSILSTGFLEGDQPSLQRLSLSGKVALVIGGTRGVGAAISIALAHAGAEVAVTYSASEAKAREHVETLEKAQGNRAAAIKHDPGDTRQAGVLLQDVMKVFRHIDIFIHTSSVAIHGKTIDDPTINNQALDLQWQVNVHGYIALVRSAALALRPGGRIIALSSSLALRVGIAGAADYAGTKAAVLGYTKGIARDLAGRKITANVVLAGGLMFETPKTRRNHLSGFYSQEDLYEEAITTDDVVRAVMFLASPTAGAITGTALDVTSGDLA
jgi:NAD(P)-dependent dehydrogenase (short-subunit alcohol dehydrogenase family)